MGWSSGSQLAEELWEDIRKDIPVARRKKIAEKIILAFENHDADDWSEETDLWVDSGRPVFDPEED